MVSPGDWLIILIGGFENALQMHMNSCMKVSVNDDLVCATADWKYMTLRRLGRKAGGGNGADNDFAEEMKIIENDSYHKRLLMYKAIAASGFRAQREFG
jgi:hypothetical protein